MSRFDELKAKLAAKGARNPAGLAAHIGRKKYGKAAFQAMAAAGRGYRAAGQGLDARMFDEQDHPRAPSGSSTGGQFSADVSGGGGNSLPQKKKTHKPSTGTMAYDPHGKTGTGYGDPHGDPRVRRLQEALTRLGLTDADGQKLKVDGKLGPKTTAAVRAAQQRLGLAQDGKVTPALLDKLTGMKALPAARSDGGADLSIRAVLSGARELRVYPAQFDIRAQPDGTGGTKYSLRGYATVYDHPYDMLDQHGQYVERVRPGAGKKTLSENPDVVLRMDHAGVPFARTKNRSLLLAEDSTGLEAYAPQLNGSRSDIHNVVAAVEDRILDEMSFAFRTTRQQWSDDYSQRDIAEYNLNRGDVSVVTFGANPSTSVALRAQDLDVMDEVSARALYERLDRRFNPPKPQRSLALIKALAEVQG